VSVEATRQAEAAGAEWVRAWPRLKAEVGTSPDGPRSSLNGSEALAVLASARERASDAGVPFVLTGDLNAHAAKTAPDGFDAATDAEYEAARLSPAMGIPSGLYAVLTDGNLPPTHPDHPARRHYQPRLPSLHLPVPRMRSAYATAHGADPPTTTRTATFSACLDYIFVSPSVRVLTVLDMPYPTHQTLEPPTQDTFPPIPNHVWPSDHVALAADIQF